MDGYNLDIVMAKVMKGKLILKVEDIIITSRTYNMAEVTLNELKQKNIYNPICFNPYRNIREDIMKFKAERINSLNIQNYYEDTIEMYSFLKRECKKCNIIFAELYWKCGGQ